MNDRKSGPGPGGFGLGLEGLRKFCDLFGFFDDVQRENIGRRRFLEFIAQAGGELVEALDALADRLGRLGCKIVRRTAASKKIARLS